MYTRKTRHQHVLQPVSGRSLSKTYSKPFACDSSKYKVNVELSKPGNATLLSTCEEPRGWRLDREYLGCALHKGVILRDSIFIRRIVLGQSVRALSNEECQALEKKECEGNASHLSNADERC